MAGALQAATEVYISALEAYEAANRNLEEAKLLLNSAEEELKSAMNDAGLDSMRNADGITFTKKRSFHYNAPAATRPQLLVELEKDGYRHLFTVNPQTLNGLMKEFVSENDGEIPERYKPFISEHDETKMSVTGRKKKG